MDEFTNELIRSIDNAVAVLSRTFSFLEEDDQGIEENTEINNATRFIDRDELIKVYSIDATIKDLDEQMSNVSKEIRKMRSAYLPIEFFKDSNGFLSQNISDKVSSKESYENTFMRMLGMPVSDAIAYGETITTVKPTGDIENVPYTTAVNILEQRQQSGNIRAIRVDDISFDLDTRMEIEAENVPRASRLDTDFFMLSYLLFPPVQDGRISKCISEVDKIVAAPFTNKRARTLSERKMKPTLLESIIRIRLDRLSGVDMLAVAAPSERRQNTLTNPFRRNDDVDTAYANMSDTYGVIESLFIVRLYSALRGLAVKMVKDLQTIAIESAKNKSVASRSESKASVKNAENKLREQKVIEDSIFTLLVDRSEAIDLQNQTQRNSSIRDSHLMSSILGVVDIPRKIIDRNIADIVKSEQKRETLDEKPYVESVKRLLGVDIGIGNVDVLVFTIALFTISEGALIGLLSDQSFDNLKNDSSFKRITLPERKGALISVNELSRFAKLAYDEFIKELRGSEA